MEELEQLLEQKDFNKDEVIKLIHRMSVEEMITYISDRKILTISGWNDGYGSVRVGTDWNTTTGELEGFLIERNNLELAVRDNLEVLIFGYESWKILDDKRKNDMFTYVKTYINIIDNKRDDEGLLEILEGWVRQRKYLPKNKIYEYMKTRLAMEHGYEEAPLF